MRWHGLAGGTSDRLDREQSRKPHPTSPSNFSASGASRRPVSPAPLPSAPLGDLGPSLLRTSASGSPRRLKAGRTSRAPPPTRPATSTAYHVERIPIVPTARNLAGHTAQSARAAHPRLQHMQPRRWARILLRPQQVCHQPGRSAILQSAIMRRLAPAAAGLPASCRPPERQRRQHPESPHQSVRRPSRKPEDAGPTRFSALQYQPRAMPSRRRSNRGPAPNARTTPRFRPRPFRGSSGMRR